MADPRRRLDELAGRYGLTEASTAALLRLLDLLAADPHAPTTVREPGEAVDAHLADALTGLEVPDVRHAGRIADLGAGAGFPGLVLAAALPEARVALVESVARKAAFIARAAEAAGLGNAEAVAARAETWEAAREACDVVTARALAALPVLAEYAAPLLREGGLLVAWKGARDAGEEAAGAAAATELGLEPAGVLPVRPFPAARHRHLHLLRKVAPTPDRFPRRPGMAANRPLGARSARRIRPPGR